MGAMHSNKVAIPEGFSDLADAKRWADGLERAEAALDSLWLQKMIYAFEEALGTPKLLRLDVYASIELPGLEIAAFVEAPDGESELGVLLVNLFKHKYASEGLTELGLSMERLRAGLLSIEQWTRSRPGMLLKAAGLGPAAERAPVRLSPYMGWRDIATAFGAHEAAMLMEKAQISKVSKGGKSSKSIRI
jgi:hypothetical protein